MSGRDDGRYLTLITWGSSSCRFHVSSTRVVEGVLEIADTTPPDRRCTADFSRNVTHRPLDPGLDLSAVDHALVRFKDRPAVTVLVAFGME